MGKRIAIATITCGTLISILSTVAIAQTIRPEILRISPTSGPEGSRVVITGKNLQEASAVFLGTVNSTYTVVSSEQILTLIPHASTTSTITVVTPRGRACSPFAFVISNDPRVPDEVGYKAGYVNPIPPRRDFQSALLWGIAIADTRIPDHESAKVEIASTQLTCRVDGKDVILNDDDGNVRGGLYRRVPWFGTDQHDPLPVTQRVWARGSDPDPLRRGSDQSHNASILPVGQRPDRVWHFWSPSPRFALPRGSLEGCTVKARVKISPGALLQIGMDYWRTPTIAYGRGGNNHEAGASNWYFPSDQWQEATFTDIGGPQF
ncbi:MAG TPA: IPT/TIG domain-containing protein [Terriglobales bacterium]|nr:IPT/TIG domain-containing protein [Terriglobales bacterium]